MIARRTQTARLPTTGPHDPDQVARSVNDLVDGHSENTGEITLASGTTETEISAPIITVTTRIILIPKGSTGASIKWWQPSTQTVFNAITIGHDAPVSDVDFYWIAIG